MLTKERDGVDMKEIHFNDIARTVAELAIEACYRLPDDMVAAMRAARTREPSPVGRNILDQLLGIAGLQVLVEADPGRQRPSEIPDLYGSNLLAQQELGWIPEIDLAASLRDVYRYWLNQALGFKPSCGSR